MRWLLIIRRMARASLAHMIACNDERNVRFAAENRYVESLRVLEYWLEASGAGHAVA